MATTSNSREADLKTSSAEERTRTFDVPEARSQLTPGPGPGDVLKNRFVLHQCLAEGSTSRLYRAMDRRLEAAGELYRTSGYETIDAYNDNPNATDWYRKAL